MTADRTAESILDLETALENLDGDVELLQEVVEIFLEMAPEQIDALESSIAERRTADVDRQAHSLKGSASNFCAVRFVSAALELERLAKSGSLEGAPGLLRRLREEFQALVEQAPAVDWDALVVWEG